jgi:hypothetical protein
MDDANPTIGRDLGVFAPPQYRSIRLYDNSWALVMGINHYDYPGIPPLQFAENDAVELAKLLPDLGFSTPNIRLLLGSRSEVTRERIQHVIEEELNPRMSPGDRLLVHFSGHGVSVQIRDRLTGCLLLADSKLQSEFPTTHNPHLSRMPSGALEMRQFLRMLDQLPAKHKQISVDSCFSGFMASARSVEGIRTNDPRLELWAEEPVTHVLTAGRSGQKAYEDPQYRHGRFTWFLMKGLQGSADPRGDGLITAEDLSAFVRHQVAAVAETPAERQDPQHYSEGQGLFLFRGIVAHSSSRRAVDNELPRHPHQAVSLGRGSPVLSRFLWRNPRL